MSPTMKAALKKMAWMIPATVAVSLSGGGCGGDDPDPTGPGIAPVAAFAGNPVSGEAPLTVTFTDQSGNSPTGWSWNFGDGATSTVQSPNHVFQVAGTFTVTLTATNAHGSDDEAKADYITVDPAAGPTPVLDHILPLGAGSGLTVTLYGENFGDGDKSPGTVMFGNVAASDYPLWRDDEIKVVVPTMNPSGVQNAAVRVVVGGRESGSVAFCIQDENVIRLTDNSADDWQPCWDGNSTICFASFVGGNFNIWYIDAGGGTAVQRTFFSEGQTDMPAASMTSTTLWYRSNHDGDWDIYESSGVGNEGCLTNTPEKDFEIVVAPSLAPFVIAISKAEEHNGGTIWNIHGYVNGNFTQISNGNADFHPAFSGNGQQVAYMYKFGDWDPGQIMVVPVHGGAVTAISDPDENCAYPTWNWAYDTIAYTRSSDNGRRNIFMCDPDGSHEVQLTFSDFDISYPIWSPDGKRLAYASFFEGNRELYVIDVGDILIMGP